MAKTELTDIKKISLDLHNFRTTPQKSEQEAINAMIIVKPDKFIGLINSLIEDGYLATDNIILLKSGSELVVKEGNRRIAILKIIHGQYNVDEFNLPLNVINTIKRVNATWKKENRKVPCAIFEASEANLVDKIVNLSHGKGEKASRDQWTSVARARHNRDSNKMSEPSLDMLEKYLSFGKNITASQRELWAGDYNLSVLDEALKKILPRLEVSNITELVSKYPKNKYWLELEDLIRAIGLAQLTFTKIRDKSSDFGTEYGINPIAPVISTTPAPSSPDVIIPSTPTATITTSQGNSGVQQGTAGGTTSSISVALVTGNGVVPANINTTITSPAFSTKDPKHVANLLRKFSPSGIDRSKVVTIREEMKKLKIPDNPIAFCFLLRSIFEISGKIYCAENGLSLTKGGGKEKTLVEVLSTVTAHLTNGNTDLSKVRSLHGALTELSKPTGILSVTSLNQLVHNTSFTISSADVCILFGNVYFLLEAMN